VLHAAGLDHLVAHSLEQYEALVRALAGDRAALAEARTALAARRAGGAPLFDLDRFVRALERGYLAAWETWRSGAPARDITVAAD
jgi:predicted O-linked N-acetylglucosamine transferase (SPINDLY family)